MTANHTQTIQYVTFFDRVILKQEIIDLSGDLSGDFLKNIKLRF